MPMVDECPHMLDPDTCADCLELDDDSPAPEFGPQIVVARWYGGCAVCSRPVEQGDDIVAVTDRGELVGWAHAGHRDEM